MSQTFEYKDFIGSVEASIEDGILFGKILFINALITYEAETLRDLKKEFEDAVDDYLEMCQENGIDATRSFAGKFNVRIPPELHKKAATMAAKQGINLNAFVTDAISHQVAACEREIPTTYRYMEQQLTIAATKVNDFDSNTTAARINSKIVEVSYAN
ncbi:type II toxin-antitoxin system HicB family antitoxin [Haemophilus sp. SZY H51]|jgi:hicB protein|uniref:type II toxin-antitoxin system HicB family antitoxin n=1 Tax=Haemophilus sp. SZY H51 TaxID=3041427 RepID=UPI0020683323|nr:type II toxin-antitoxin system HicB family antitoxin [Haemophilus sp. SZY H51]MDN3211504.1 type II toxin-antitoxin system HicB family antitoxin [Haemophilus sp. SZY H51]DAV02562.1 MAG TPA: putative nuclease [Bacteriophage sp.]